MKLLLCLLMVSAVFARTGKIAGMVVDENGEGIIGAAAMIVETKQGGSVRNPDGSFVILGVAPGLYTLRVLSIGYKPQTFVAVQVNDDGTADNIYAVLEFAKIETSGCFPFRLREHVRLDECNRVRRLTRNELQRLPGW